MKKLLSLFLLLVLIVSLCPTASAGSARLLDGADLLTADEESVLCRKLDNVSARLGMDIAVVTVDDIEPYGYSDLEQFCEDYFDEHYSSGVLLTLCMAERNWYVTSKGGGTALVKGRGLATLSDRFLTYLRQNDYAGGFAAFADGCVAVSDTLAANGGRQPFDLKTALLISLGVGLVVALIVCLILKGQLRSVRSRYGAGDYVRPGSMHLREERDVFLYSTVSSRPRPKSSSDSDSDGGHVGGGGSF